MRAAQFDIGPDEDLFDMANLSPNLTGLPMVVWISERGRGQARRAGQGFARPLLGERALTRRHRFRYGRTCVWSRVRCLTRATWSWSRCWVELNRDALLAYWNGDLLTDEVIARLQPAAAG